VDWMQDATALKRLREILRASCLPIEKWTQVIELCKGLCGFDCTDIAIGYLDEDVQSMSDWVQQTTSTRATDVSWVGSWLFALKEIPRNGGRIAMVVEMEGYAAREWDDIELDERVYFADSGYFVSRGLQAIYSAVGIGSALDMDPRQPCVEYVACLGFVSIVVQYALRSRPVPILDEKSIFVCWPGGDYIELTC
jgi:hypothetical protein